MKGISLWQPWGSLWVSPAKIDETRHWPTSYRGWLLVHAAKKIVYDVGHELEDILHSEFGGHWGMDMPRGAIVGAINLVDCISTVDVLVTTDEERDNWLCGDFTPGRFAWRRSEFKRFREPIPFKGRQGFFDVPDELVREAMAA
jgi:hypothetical protein